MARIKMWKTGICRYVSHKPSTVIPLKGGDNFYSLQIACYGLRGFTLIELLAVILILSITISFIVPNIIGTDNIELRNAARKLLYTTKKLSDDAVFKKEKMVLNLDIDGRGYGDKEDGHWVKLPQNVAIEEVLLGKKEIRSGKVRIIFFPSGMRDETLIRLSDRKGKKKYVLHIPALGERFEVREE